jgi:type IV pilus assembly protein PilW
MNKYIYFEGTTRQQGVTLVELLIAMLLGVLILAGVIQIFLSAQKSFRLQENLSRVQENGRFAMQFLSRDLRMAGYSGCVALNRIEPAIQAQPQNPNPNPVIDSFNLNTKLTGHNNVADDWSSDLCGNHLCVEGSDEVSIQYAGSCGGYLTGNMATDNANIQIPADNTCQVQKYDVLLLSDCKAADLFIATSASSGNGKQTIAHAANQNISPKLSQVYGEDAELFRFQSYRYFLRLNDNDRPGLWRFDNTQNVSSSNPMELIENVENMQILYGEDISRNGSADYYVPENEITDPANIVSLRISLLLVTPDDFVASRRLSYGYNGETIQAQDQRIRRQFVTTLNLRNH